MEKQQKSTNINVAIVEGDSEELAREYFRQLEEVRGKKIDEKLSCLPKEELISLTRNLVILVYRMKLNLQVHLDYDPDPNSEWGGYVEEAQELLQKIDSINPSNRISYEFR